MFTGNDHGLNKLKIWGRGGVVFTVHIELKLAEKFTKIMFKSMVISFDRCFLFELPFMSPLTKRQTAEVHCKSQIFVCV